MRKEKKNPNFDMNDCQKDVMSSCYTSIHAYKKVAKKEYNTIMSQQIRFTFYTDNKTFFKQERLNL